jgi:hypothetical protein
MIERYARFVLDVGLTELRKDYRRSAHAIPRAKRFT